MKLEVAFFLIVTIQRIDRSVLVSLTSPSLFSRPSTNLFVVFQADVARARPSGILRMLPRLCGRGSCRDGLQTLLRLGLVTRRLFLRSGENDEQKICCTVEASDSQEVSPGRKMLCLSFLQQ